MSSSLSRRTSRRTRRLAAASLLLAAPGLTACGFGAQTDQPYQPGVGSNVRGESLNVLGATVVLPFGTEGTFSASIANSDPSSPAQLTGITGEDVEVQLLEELAVPADGLLNLSDTGAVLVTFNDDTLSAGGYTRMTLSFDTGEEIEINVPIVNDEEEFADVVPAEAPSETPSATPGATPEASETAAP